MSLVCAFADVYICKKVIITNTTVEPPYKELLGTRHIYTEVVLSLEVLRYELCHLGPLNLSFTWRFFSIVSLYRVSIKSGITILPY